jgi:alpha-galactosidase
LINRRSFIGQGLTAGLILASNGAASVTGSQKYDSTFIDLLRLPDLVTVFSGLNNRIDLQRSGEAFAENDVVVSVHVRKSESRIVLVAPKTALTHVHLRWRADVPSALSCLGDHWERSYGDLSWRCMTPERVMPWYFATHDGHALHSYGVKSGAAALCFWQVDPEGVSLWLDVSNGGEGVLLGNRELMAASVVTRHGVSGESPVAALRAFCKQMCPKPRLPEGAVYGANDWYCAYGKNSQDMLLRIADLIAEVSPARGARPFTVVDDGWKGNPKFPSMSAFADQVQKRGVRPGIWIRPLIAPEGTDARLLLPAKRFGRRSERYGELAFDPTIPDALATIRDRLRQLADWNFELVKHDFSTYDLLGKWGFEMGAQPTNPGWHFHDRGRTNAEIVLDFYKAIRQTLGEKIQILGCNTIGHLGAGVFELQRTGDDTSGQVWERTRRMGVNTLAYRLPQHRTFFCVDADCVGITRAIPWELNRQWLDLIARTGTALFVSPAEDAVGPEQRKALKEAFALVGSAGAVAEPADFLHETTPETWIAGKQTKRYEWCTKEGALPFGV